MLHYAVLYGTEEGLVAFPAARNLQPPELIVTGPCSPMTDDLELFNQSVQMQGNALDPLFSDFYFVPQCATTNDFAANAIEMTDPRIYRFTRLIFFLCSFLPKKLC